MVNVIREITIDPTPEQEEDKKLRLKIGYLKMRFPGIPISWFFSKKTTLSEFLSQ
jgi:hypothetical protein